jgi:hypothetical protein
MNTTPTSATEKQRRRLPQWQRAGLRKLQWQALGFIALIVVLSATVISLTHRLFGWDSPGYWMILTMVLTFGPTTITYLAYQRGVSDGRAHPSDNDAAFDTSTPNQARQRSAPRSDA